MLKIDLSPSGPSPVTYADFKTYHLPVPSKGVNAKDDSYTELLFDNEYEAVVYADELEEIVTNVSKSSPLRSIMRDMITTIRNDDSIRNYLEDSSIYLWLKNKVKVIRSAIKPSGYLLQ